MGRDGRQGGRVGDKKGEKNLQNATDLQQTMRQEKQKMLLQSSGLKISL